MSQSEQPNETVILVHGTWAAPIEGKRQWYQWIDGLAAEQSFVAKLDDALARHGSSARCWKHCAPGRDAFFWSGANSWFDRTRAASALAYEIRDLEEKGWRCHVVAHSHGGNVLAEAVSKLHSDRTGMRGSMIALGTPFFDAMSPISRRHQRRRRVTSILDWIIVSFLALFAIMVVFGTASDMSRHGSLRPGGEIVLPLALFLAMAAGMRVWQQLSRFFRRRRQASQQKESSAILAINSNMDEAWQTLHHITRLQNPLTPSPTLFSHLWASRRDYLYRTREVARIEGATSFFDLTLAAKIVYCVVVACIAFLALVLISTPPHQQDGSLYGGVGMFIASLIIGPVLVFGWRFYSALWSPLRWIRRHVSALSRIPGDASSYFVRRQAWVLLQKFAMGLDGYRYSLPQIGFTPNNMQGVKFEELPPQAVRRALARRSEWLGKHFGAVSDTFAKLALTAADIQALLRMISNDLSLVHAAYYTDDECIDRIARWIAGKG